MFWYSLAVPQQGISNKNKNTHFSLRITDIFISLQKHVVGIHLSYGTSNKNTKHVVVLLLFFRKKKKKGKIYFSILLLPKSYV